MTAQFTNLGIQCVKKKESPDSLKIREEIRVDPFKQGFAHRNSGMNLNAVRLCFQVFLRNGTTLGMHSAVADTSKTVPGKSWLKFKNRDDQSTTLSILVKNLEPSITINWSKFRPKNEA